MEHTLQDGESGGAHLETPGPAQAPPGGEEATDTPSDSRGGVLKHRPKTMYDLKVGPPGSRSSEEAVVQIRRAVQEAIGLAPPDIGDPKLYRVLSQRVRSLFETMPDDPRPPRYTVRSSKPGEKSAEGPPALPPTTPDERDRVGEGRRKNVMVELKGGPFGSDSSESNGREEGTEPKSLHADMLFSVIPRRWYKHVRVLKGRGATRSERVYFEAIHILAYIVFMYRDHRRFDGDILHMNQKSICKMIGITSDDYLKAIRYLEREGYITRVVLRGLVPWDARVLGVYTFAIPRLPKLGGVTIFRKGETKVVDKRYIELNPGSRNGL